MLNQWPIHRADVTAKCLTEVGIKMAFTVSGEADTAAPCSGDAEGFAVDKKRSRIDGATPERLQFNGPA